MDAIRKLTEAFDWLRIPFTFGEAYSRRSDGEDDAESIGLNKEDREIVQSKSYNGRISSSQLFIAMEVVFGVQLLSHYMSVSESVSGMQLRINLMVYMAVGLVIMVIIYNRRHGLLSSVESGDSREVKDSEHDNVILAGILMFYVLSTVCDLLHIVSAFSCREAWFICGSSYFVAKDMVHITYHVVRVIFLTSQTLFCMVFNRAQFINQSMIRHGLMILQAVNISFWTYETLRASDSELHGSAESFSRRVNRFTKYCLSNSSNHSFDLMACLSRNDTLHYYSTKYSNSILRPFGIEYSLLIGECLMSWFFTCAAKSTENVNRRTARRSLDSHLGSENSLDAGNTVTLRNRQSRSSSAAEQTDELDLAATLQPHAPVRPSLDLSSRVLAYQVLQSQSSQSQFLTFLLLMISIIVNLILAVIVFVPRILKASLGPSAHLESMRAIAPYYSCIYYILMITVMALGYHVSRYFRVLKNAPFNGLDYLLLFTSSGTLAFDLLRLIAITRTDQEVIFTSNTTRMFYAGYVFFEVIEVLFQVSFSLYAGRLRVNKQVSSLKPILFRAITLFLALCNLTTWIVQTFATSVTSHRMMTRYFGLSGWPYVSNTLIPMFLFFRFNSFLMFIRIYRRLCKQ